MSKKTKSIPVNPLAKEFDMGIAIGKILSYGSEEHFEEANHSHRHDYHFFLFSERGSAQMEIDFEKYKIKARSVLYIHPDQVHRILKAEQADFHLLGISDEKLNADYLKLLEDLVPAKPLVLSADIFSIIKQSIGLCTRIFEEKQGKLYPSLLKEACNTLVGLVLSQYMEGVAAPDKLSRFNTLNKAFKVLLERDFSSLKRPSDYSLALNISTAYLNESVRNVTGFPVSYHIQQRIVLEAKRLLYHSNKSVKEIAAELGYEDAAYFSRLFTKTTGMSALAFRNKNLA